MEFETVIGLEVHAQLASNTKAWCSCEIKVNDFENTKVCEVCSAQPGSLPVINQKVIDFAIRTGLALNCQINHLSFLDRKNYFYPDLPKGYQITQYEKPVASEGFLLIDGEMGNKKIGIERIQIEEDTGKSTHLGENSLINLNRAGTPLLEIVGKPDLRSAKEASSYFKKLHSILVYLGVCKGNMQDGNLRCDVNVSLREKGDKKFGIRSEVKNLNSFRFVEKAIEYEVERHKEILLGGGVVPQQTLLFDVNQMKTIVMRTKSDADDYRYFHEPDLLPVIITDDKIKEIKEKLPELPDEKIERFQKQYKIPAYDASVLSSSKDLAHYFEEAARFYKGEVKKISNWIMVELLRLLNEAGTSITNSPVSPKELAELMNAVVDGTISGKTAKDVFVEMYDNKIGAREAIEKLGVTQVSDEAEIEKLAKEIIEKNQAQYQQYMNGKDKLFGFFVGQLMKATKGQANPQVANKILSKLLKK